MDDSQLLIKAEEFLRKQHQGLQLLLKMGEKGSILTWIDKDKKFKQLKVPALKFSDYDNLSLVDTTAAGDTYTAAYSVHLGQQKTRGKTPID